MKIVFRKIRYRLVSLFIFILIFSSLAFSQTSSDSTESAVHKFDMSVFRNINNHRYKFLDFYIPIIDKSVFPVTAITPISLFAFGNINDVSYDANSGVLLGLSEATAFGTSYLVKAIVKKKRPFNFLKVLYSNKNNSFTDVYSFPSIHSAESFALATSLSLRYHDQPVMIAGLYLYALSVGYGRIYLGVHYPSDVIAGALIGAGSSVLIYSLRKEIIKAKNDIFNIDESEIKDKDKNNGYLVLGSVIAGGILNQLLIKSGDPVLSKTRLSLDLLGSVNRFGLQISF